MSEAAGAAEETLGLEARLSRLEAIVDRLEGDELELDDALVLFREGIEHVREARKVLDAGELEIERLVDSGGGEPRLEYMESAGETAGASAGDSAGESAGASAGKADRESAGE